MPDGHVLHHRFIANGCGQRGASNVERRSIPGAGETPGSLIRRHDGGPARFT
jgi:hypothetical protein